MNVERIERIANFVCHACGQQCQGLASLILDCRKCFLTRLRGVVKNQRHTTPTTFFGVKRGSVDMKESLSRIVNFKFVSRDALSACAIHC